LGTWTAEPAPSGGPLAGRRGIACRGGRVVECGGGRRFGERCWRGAWAVEWAGSILAGGGLVYDVVLLAEVAVAFDLQAVPAPLDDEFALV
jgi:hypothetical protein